MPRDSILVLTLCLLPVACSAKSVGESFEFDAPFERLEIDLPTGSVTVVGHEGAGATVEATSHWQGSRKPDLDVAIEGKALVIRVDCGALSICSVDAKVHVPHEVELHMQGSTGDLVVRDFGGKIDAELSTGSVALKRVRGQLRLETKTGDVQGSELASERVWAETATGRLELAFVGGASDVEVQATTGRIDLELPSGQYAVEAETTTGAVSVEVEQDAKSEHRIVAETTTGSITVRPG